MWIPPRHGVGKRGESSSPPVRGQEATHPSPPPTGGCEIVEPSPPHIGEWQTVGPSLPSNVPEVVDPSTSTVQDCTDDDMEGFVTVSRKKGQKRSCPVVNETKAIQSKILVMSNVPSLQDASHIENPSSGLEIEPEPIITLTNSFAHSLNCLSCTSVM